MADFDYGNARLKAMKARLLARREMEGLVESGSLQGLIAALTGTAYRKAVESALARTTGIECITEALRNDLVITLGKIRSFYSGQAGEMVRLVLGSYDVHNLRAILRGLEHHTAPGEILAALLPVGDLSYETLIELSRAPGPRGAIDRLASMGLPPAYPLLALRAAHPGATIADMELALEKWYFEKWRAYLEESGETDSELGAALALEADLANLLTVLRYTHTPEDRRGRVPGSPELSQGIPALLIGPGKLAHALLGQAASQPSVKAAIELFSGSRYEAALRAGLESYNRSLRLSEFERHLARFRLNWMTGMILRDPLGIGVVLGYSTLKIQEVNNIRWIAHGIHQGMKTDEIRAGLELPA